MRGSTQSAKWVGWILSQLWCRIPFKITLKKEIYWRKQLKSLNSLSKFLDYYDWVESWLNFLLSPTPVLSLAKHLLWGSWDLGCRNEVIGLLSPNSESLCNSSLPGLHGTLGTVVRPGRMSIWMQGPREQLG